MFQHMVKRSLFYLVLIYPRYLTILGILTCSAYALPTDKEKVMHVKADTANLNQHERKGIYAGNVELIQGTSNLQAAKAITIGNEKNQLVLAVASGVKEKQAHYWTVADLKKPPLHAYANTIRYYPLRHVVELIGDARVEQGNNSFSAAKITYDIEKQQVLSQGDSKKRIIIIYHPEKKSS